MERGRRNYRHSKDRIHQGRRSPSHQQGRYYDQTNLIPEPVGTHDFQPNGNPRASSSDHHTRNDSNHPAENSRQHQDTGNGSSAGAHCEKCETSKLDTGYIPLNCRCLQINRGHRTNSTSEPIQTDSNISMENSRLHQIDTADEITPRPTAPTNPNHRAERTARHIQSPANNPGEDARPPHPFTGNGPSPRSRLPTNASHGSENTGHHLRTANNNSRDDSRRLSGTAPQTAPRQSFSDIFLVPGGRRRRRDWRGNQRGGHSDRVSDGNSRGMRRTSSYREESYGGGRANYDGPSSRGFRSRQGKEYQWNGHGRDNIDEKNSDGRRGLGRNWNRWEGAGSDPLDFDEVNQPVESGSMVRQPIAERINEQDENRTKSRKRKRVRGGRIPEKIKIREFKEAYDLFCEACDRYFDDANAKACHDKSKDHRTCVGQLRVEEAGKVQKVKVEESASKRKVMSFSNEEVTALLSKKRTRAFDDWAKRSADEATKGLSNGNGDTPSSVLREILHAYQVSTEQCTMFQTAWNRKPLATGRHYLHITPTVIADKFVTEEQAQRMTAIQEPEPGMNGTSESNAVAAADAANADKEGTGWIRGGFVDSRGIHGLDEITPEPLVQNSSDQGHDSLQVAHTAAAVHNEIDVPMEIEELDVTNETGGHGAARVTRNRRKPKVTPVSNKLSCAARRMLFLNKVDNKQLLVMQARRRFPVMNWSMEEEKEDDSTSNTQLFEKYGQLRNAFEAADYDYEKWSEEVKEVIAQMQGCRHAIVTLQSCYQMLAKAGITKEDWSGSFTACDELVKMYRWTDDFGQQGFQYVGFWILLSLFKSAKRVGIRESENAHAHAFSPFLELNSWMRGLPPKAFENEIVFECWEVWLAVLTNNYFKFFQMSRNALMHLHTGNCTQYIMEALEDFVRERALLSMCCLSEVLETPVYNPHVMTLGSVMSILGWEDEHAREETGVDEAQANARDFIQELPQGLVLTRIHGKLAMLNTQYKLAEIGLNDVVDVQKILWMDRKIVGGGWRDPLKKLILDKEK